MYLDMLILSIFLIICIYVVKVIRYMINLKFFLDMRLKDIVCAEIILFYLILINVF